MATTDVVGVKYEADIKQLQSQLDKLIADNARLEKQVDKIGDEYTQTGNQGAAAMNKVDTATKGVSKSAGTMTSVLNNAGAALLTAFSIQAVVQIGKQIVEVTGKFQRYAAVLENTLGSKSEAQKALMMIQKFAAETPFSVDQLTDSYIRLTNSGFQPTQDELRKLGDLASSQGKQFDQLAEAIIDAQTGEFERLKEFGIRASKEGDNVKFSFKGVETQTKFTSAAIQDYILSLGDLQGVAGGMNAISTTLEGRISNLGDSWGQFLNNLGAQTSGVFFEVIEGFSNLLTALNAMLETEEQKMLKLQNEAKEAAFQQSQNWSDKELQLVIDSLSAQRAVVMADYKQAEKDGFEFKQKELLAQFNHLANQEQGLKDVLSDRQKGRIEDQKNAEKDAERQRKEDEKRAKEAEKFRQEMLKMQFDTQALRIELMDEGIGKELAKQQLGYLKEREQYRNNKEALLLIDQKYLKERQEIIDKYAVKQIDITRDVGKEVEKEREKEVKTQFEIAQEGIKNWETLNEDRKERDKEREEQQAADRLSIEENTFASLNALGDLFIQDEAKRAQFQKTLAVFQLGLDTARAISAGVAASAGVPFPGNLVAILTTVATVLGNVAQAKALLSSANPPGFKDGVLDIQGPGTETSDSIAARLSKGESVMTANQTKAWKSELKAMRAGNFEDVVFAKYVLPALQEDRRQRDTASNMAQSLSLQNMFDDKRIVAELKANKPASSKDIQKLDKTIQRTFKDSAYVRSKMWKN
jgi:hypothetical protein